MSDFLLYATVGFVAQLIDGALGLGYGVICSSVLLATGVPPSHTSASVHAAKLFTTAASGAAHLLHGNVDRRLVGLLCLTGSIGGVLGAVVLVHAAAGAIRPFVFAYLALMGIVIIVRGLMLPGSKTVGGKLVAPLGIAGGFLDAIGGGGWGPVVTSSLLGAGAAPRDVVGTVNAAEFVVTCTVVSAFAAAIALGVWQGAEGLADHLLAVAALVAGGIPSALLAGWLLKVAPRKPLMIAVGLLICALSGWEFSRILG